MGWSVRAYLRGPSGELTRIPYARFERLFNRDRREALPEYAGGYACLAIAYLETQAGDPLRIARIDYPRLKLDAKGRLDPKAHERLLRLAADSLDLGFLAPRARGVIEARHSFARRQREAEFHWRPTQAQQASIVRSALRPLRSRG